MPVLCKMAPQAPVVWGLGALIVSMPIASRVFRRFFGEADDQNIISLISVLLRFGKVDFSGFMRKHREFARKGEETGDFVPGVCNYYSLMSDVITMTSGPFWHFVPMFAGMTRAECHHKYHQTLTDFLEAKKGDKVLELGCGYGEMGRQVALIAGSNVTGLTMADEEIVGGMQRIEAAGLKGQCQMVQGNYHELPFEAESFDKVFAVYTLKYSSNLEKALGEAARVLKPGGKFLSYEILTTDEYQPNDKVQRDIVENISASTCMPPLWHAQAMRDAAAKAGLVPAQEQDLCGPGTGAQPWYSCFERSGIHSLLSCRLLLGLIKVGESVHALPRGFSDWFAHCVIHPTTDFVNGGRSGIISGAVMMTWTKPQ